MIVAAVDLANRPVNLSLSHSLSVADKVGMQQIMGVTPKTSLLTKRKRTDSDAHMKTASI